MDKVPYLIFSVKYNFPPNTGIMNMTLIKYGGCN